MDKVRGMHSKRPTSLGHDAVKPEGWEAPDLTKYLGLSASVLDSIQTQDLEVIQHASTSPRILVIGHARHGKDLVSEMLRDDYGMAFTSSSQFCAEHVVWNAIHEGFAIGLPALQNAKLKMLQGVYASSNECFEDRKNHRTLWYELIAAYNWPDASMLGRAIFEDNNVYCGLRSSREFNALKNAGLYDLCIWVDRKKYVKPESKESCTVEPWMADNVLDNNGSLEDLKNNLKVIMDNYGYGHGFGDKLC
jgi:hypothetical protein